MRSMRGLDQLQQALSTYYTLRQWSPSAPPLAGAIKEMVSEFQNGSAVAVVDGGVVRHAGRVLPVTIKDVKDEVRKALDNAQRDLCAELGWPCSGGKNNWGAIYLFIVGPVEESNVFLPIYLSADAAQATCCGMARREGSRIEIENYWGAPSRQNTLSHLFQIARAFNEMCARGGKKKKKGQRSLLEKL